MKSIYYLLYWLLFPSIAIAADNEFNIKLKGLPFDGVEWGSSPQKLNIDQKELDCEQIEPNKENRTQGKTVCNFFAQQNGRSIGFFFTNNRFLDFMISSKPADFGSELKYYSNSIGMEPMLTFHEADSDRYIWETAYHYYKLVCEKSSGKCRLFGNAGSYVEISTRKPAKEKFKLLELTFGYSTPKDFVEIANLNKWKWHDLPPYNTYYVSNIGIDDVVETKFEFVDDKLVTISYGFDPNKIKESFVF
jgi:hypothetical protein